MGVSTRKLLVEGEEEPVSASDDELGLDDDMVVWGRKLDVEEGV